MKNITIDQKMAGQRLDKALYFALKEKYTRSHLQEAIKKGLKTKISFNLESNATYLAQSARNVKLDSYDKL